MSQTSLDSREIKLDGNVEEIKENFTVKSQFSLETQTIDLMKQILDVLTFKPSLESQKTDLIKHIVKELNYVIFKRSKKCPIRTERRAYFVECIGKICRLMDFTSSISPVSDSISMGIFIRGTVCDSIRKVDSTVFENINKTWNEYLYKTAHLIVPLEEKEEKKKHKYYLTLL